MPWYGIYTTHHTVKHISNISPVACCCSSVEANLVWEYTHCNTTLHMIIIISNHYVWRPAHFQSGNAWSGFILTKLVKCAITVTL